MIRAEIDPRDWRELQADLRDLTPERLLRSELDPFGQRVIEIAGSYPPPVSGYERTGHLRRSWYHRLMGLDLKIGNLAAYAGWVHGEQQIELHKRHGWRRLLDVATSEVDKMIRKLEDKAGRIWDGP